ncbi:unnamed protein product [Ixodes persulcatus]
MADVDDFVDKARSGVVSSSRPNAPMYVCSSQFGHLLSSSADIAERILRFMNGRQLNTCARVCSLWNSTAQRLKCRRAKFSHCFEMLKRKRKAASGSSGEPSSDISEEAADRFLRQLRGAWCEPRHALVFATSKASTFLSPGRSQRTCTDDHLEVARVVGSHLPSACHLLLGRASGVVGTPGDGHPTELERCQGVSGLLLPSVLPDGTRVRPFAVTQAHVRKQSRGDDWYATDEFKTLAGLPVGDATRDVKCVLWFIGSDLDEGENDVAAEMVDDFVASCGPHRFALGGAVLDSLAAAQADRVVCAGLCFSGDGVRSASVVLPPEVRGAQAVEKELRRLKVDSGFGSWGAGQTLGFAFACVARGAGHHGRPNVEADAFARVFPGVPLIGLFGNGEIGNEHLPLRADGCHSANESCMYGYTTVVVLLSLGK